MDMRIYYIVWTPNAARWVELKAAGAEQTSLETCIKSRDSSKIVLKSKVALPLSLEEVVFQGSLSELHVYFTEHLEEWQAEEEFIGQ
jgi:hypothetical protein